MKRVEDRHLLRGEGSFTENIQLPKMATMVLVRSIYAHARIKTIDADATRATPGVLKVLTGLDVRHLGPILAYSTDCEHPSLRPLLATSEVLYAGEPIAAVIAEDRATAMDAAELMSIDYEPLSAVSGLESAAAGEIVFREEFASNVALRYVHGDLDRTEAAVAGAEVVVRQRMLQPRLAGSPLETRAVIASYRSPASLTVWTSTQIPHVVSSMLAHQLGLPEQSVRVISEDVGGGFGVKLNYYLEEPLTALASQLLGRPVRWIEQRGEAFVASTHGRGQQCDVTIASDPEGHLLAVRFEVLADLGAYLQMWTLAVPQSTRYVGTSVYRVPQFAFDLTELYTNRPPTDAYRGAGRPEAIYYMERAMDMLAAELQMDPAELRRRNWLATRDEFPILAPSGMEYDSGDYGKALDLLLGNVSYEALRFQQLERRKSSSSAQLGVGFSVFTEVCGLGPSKEIDFRDMGVALGCWEQATIRILPSGSVLLLSGTQPSGQGHHTAWTQIVAESLGIPVEKIRVQTGDTLTVPYGVGTFGSRSAPVGGTAVHQAAIRIEDQARALAAHLLEIDIKDVEFDAGQFFAKGAPDRAVGWVQLASAAYVGDSLPPGMEPGLEATARFDPPGYTYPFGAHMAVVDVDTETGLVNLLSYSAVDDCGTIINPLLVAGQIQGGLAQGIAQALFEEVVFDDQGTVVNPSFLEYKIPSAIDLPSFRLDHTVTPSPHNSLGVKGVGEAGAIGSPPAVVNAVVDALQPFGVTHLDMPVTPERVLVAIRAARTRSAIAENGAPDDVARLET